jgi:lipopolysaccharide transport system ATP-binding protein
MSSDDVLIRAQNLGKSYQLYEKPHHRLLQTLFRGKRQFYREFWALQGVSLELRRSESLGILGRNGAGKSTLLQILSGVLAPTTGNLEVTGRVAALLELGSGFNPEFTGRENAYLNGSILGLSQSEMERAMPEIERFAGVGEFFDQPVKLYSSGMLVRVAFAVQVQLKPDILIVDEALAVGDAIFQKRCFQRIRDLLETGVSLIFVTHDLEGVRLFTQKAILLEHGKITAAGASKSVLNVYQQKNLEEEKNYLESYIAEQVALIAPCEEPPAERSDDGGARARKDNEYGTFEAVVTKLEIQDGTGRCTNSIVSGEPLRILMSFTVHAELDTLIASIRIRNREGVKCYSWGTLNQDINQGSLHGQTSFWGKRFRAGNSYLVEFITESCVLGAGFYEVEAILTKRAAANFFEHETSVHWLHDAAFFSVRTEMQHFFGGICDLRMKARLFEEEKDGVK